MDRDLDGGLAEHADADVDEQAEEDEDADADANPLALRRLADPLQVGDQIADRFVFGSRPNNSGSFGCICAMRSISALMTVPIIA